MGINRAGDAADPLRQSGQNGNLSVRQTGTATGVANANLVGTNDSSANPNGGTGPNLGVDQTGARNALDVTQNGARNKMLQVQQAAGGSAAATTNSATVGQTGSDNTVSNVTQSHDGGAANSAAITQGGGGLVGTDRSRAQAAGGGESGVIQTGHGNSLNLVQGAGGQVTRAVVQDNAGSGKGGNTLNLTLEGSRNGAGISDGTAPVLGAKAAASGAAASTARQTGGNNSIAATDGGQFTISGTENQYGFTQAGDDHKVYGAGVVGGYNSLGVYQSGTESFAEVSVNGDENDLGIRQLGTYNRAKATQNGALNRTAIVQDGNTNHAGAENFDAGRKNVLTITQTGNFNAAFAYVSGAGSDENSARIVQTGNRNFGQTTQRGDLNTADISVTGDANRTVVNQGNTGNRASITVFGSTNDVEIGQSADGAANTATVGITGSNNLLAVMQNHQNTATVTINGNDSNRRAFAPGSLAANAASGAGMVAGLMVQDGFGNDLNFDVGSLGAPASHNSFAVRQNGNANRIGGTINGTANNAVIVQTGNANTTVFSQTGGNNTMVVRQ